MVKNHSPKTRKNIFCCLFPHKTWFTYYLMPVSLLHTAISGKMRKLSMANEGNIKKIEVTLQYWHNIKNLRQSKEVFLLDGKSVVSLHIFSFGWGETVATAQLHFDWSFPLIWRDHWRLCMNFLHENFFW